MIAQRLEKFSCQLLLLASPCFVPVSGAHHVFHQYSIIESRASFATALLNMYFIHWNFADLAYLGLKYSCQNNPMETETHRGNASVLSCI